MSTDNHMPDWVQTLFEEIASGIQFKGFADMEGHYAEPDETSWGIHLLEMAPSLMDLSELGAEAEEGEQGYGIIHSFDLLATQEAFDEVAGLSFGIENDGRSCITIEGKVGGQDVAVLIYITPFEDIEDDDEIIKDNTFDEEA